MTQFIQALVNGVALASIYALIALGFVIIFKSTQVLNFAQPGLLVIGAWWVVFATDAPDAGLSGGFWAFVVAAAVIAVGGQFAGRRGLVTKLVARVVSYAAVAAIIVASVWVQFIKDEEIGGLGWPFWAAVLLAVVIAAITGVVIERAFLRPMVGKPVFAVAIMTIGIDAVLRTLSTDTLGTQIRSVDDPWGLGLFRLGDIVLTYRQLAQVLTTAVLVAALLVFFKYSRLGLAMRAAAFDQEVALSQGVSVSTVFATSWAIAAVLAMVAGVFLGSGFGISPGVAGTALKALPVVVVGGLDSIPGAIVGALLIAVGEQMTSTYQPQYAEFLGRNFATVVPYLIMFIVLLVRPFGLFGTKEVERV